MEHKTQENLRLHAAVYPEHPANPMTRQQKIERWAELLEREPQRKLSTIAGTEYRPSAERSVMRAAATPISVAFDDPVLRAEGLKDDTYGEARRFFGISDHELHRIVCECHYGAAVNSAVAARMVRKMLPRQAGHGLFARLRKALAARFLQTA
jgi:hypothetical protein